MKRVLVKEEVCMGCHLCEVYCQLRHAQSPDLVKAFKKEMPHPVARLRVEENNPVSFTVRCQQCKDAACAAACITGALRYNMTTNLVEVNEDKCIGCWTCILACPFGAIRQDTANHRTVRCDLCAGDIIPACVQNCPNEALVFAEAE